MQQIHLLIQMDIGCHIADEQVAWHEEGEGFGRHLRSEVRSRGVELEAKTHLDLGRDLTIEILEYFDRIHFTQRQGNARRVRDADLPQKMFA